MNEKDVFISYSSNDRAFATRLYDELYAQGVAVWMDVADIPPGHRWDRVIQEALETCTHLILVHTQASFESDNVWDEWSFFLQRNKPVIPLIVENVKLPFRLERVHHVDFCTQAFDHAIRQLVQVLPHFEPSPTPGLVTRWPNLAQRRERLKLHEDREERDVPPQRKRKLHQREESYGQYAFDEDSLAQPPVDDPFLSPPLTRTIDSCSAAAKLTSER
ncbi:MAG: toll/interleukin-1 receptor domain-containing protein [Chloroflexi bacterium]|nr:toll/interleukin-1 receptor domain-containing protein [Chloroflexota bacterium]